MDKAKTKADIEKIIEIEEEALKKLEPIYERFQKNSKNIAIKYLSKLSYMGLLNSKNYLETIYRKLK